MSKSKFKLKKYLKSTDRVLISLCAITSIYSCILLFSLGINDKIAMSVFSKQAIFSALGLIIAIIVSKLDYEFMAKMWKLHMPVALTLTLLTFTSLGVQRAEYIDDARPDGCGGEAHPERGPHPEAEPHQEAGEAGQAHPQAPA